MMFTPRQKIKKLRQRDWQICDSRDQEYLKLAIFGGDRPGDLEEIKIPEILRFPSDDGFRLNRI